MINCEVSNQIVSCCYQWCTFEIAFASFVNKVKSFSGLKDQSGIVLHLVFISKALKSKNKMLGVLFASLLKIQCPFSNFWFSALYLKFCIATRNVDLGLPRVRVLWLINVGKTLNKNLVNYLTYFAVFSTFFN